MEEQRARESLAHVTPEQFSSLVKAASDEQITDTIHEAGTERVLERIFAGMQDRFLPDRARGVDAAIQFVIIDQGREHPYVVTIEAGTCSAQPGRADSPTVTLTADLVPFVRMTAGQATGIQLFMTGRLKVAGDLMFGQRVATFFEQPRA